MRILRSAAVAATMLAGATMIAAPVAAASRTVPVTMPPGARPIVPLAWVTSADTYRDHRWERERHRDDGFDGGDLLGVLLIGGGIAAVVAAIGKDKQERRADRTDGRDYPGTQRPYGYRSGASRDSDRQQDRAYGRDNTAGRADYGETDRAVRACSAEAARGGEVDEIYDVAKVDGEWRIKGDYRTGREFICTVDGNGKAYVGPGDRAANDARGTDTGQVAQAADGSDDRYATGRSPDFADPRGR